eukprot:3882525-Prymnesium_polylepis.1
MTNPATGTAMTMQEATKFVHRFDFNSDGQLDLEEFTRAMSRAMMPKPKPKPKPRPEPSPEMRCAKGGEHTFAFGKCTKVCAACVAL